MPFGWIANLVNIPENSQYRHKNGIKYSNVLERENLAFGMPALSKTRIYEWHKICLKPFQLTTILDGTL